MSMFHSMVFALGMTGAITNLIALARGGHPIICLIGAVGGFFAVAASSGAIQ